jgi:hypothetical protein
LFHFQLVPANNLKSSNQSCLEQEDDKTLQENKKTSLFLEATLKERQI